MQIAQLDQIKLAYEDKGSGEPVILVHGGLFADAYVPLMTQPLLADHYRLIRYHRRGYGESDHPDTPFSYEDQADDCLKIMRHLGIERAHIVGNSRSASMGIVLAGMAPDAVASLSLLEPGLNVDPSSSSGMMDKVQKGFAQAREGDLTGAVEALMAVAFRGRAAVEKVLPGGFAQALKDAATFVGGESDGVWKWQFSAEDAAKIKTPILAVLGADSPEAFHIIHKKVFGWFPHVDGLTIPGADHGLYLYAPQQVAEALVPFFRRHPITR